MMRDDMRHDEIDRILSREDEILPSSGFAVSVIDAVRREAAAPPPIPFPWMWALPGLVVASFVLALVLVAVVVVSAQLGTGTVLQPSTSSLSLSFPPSLFAPTQGNLGTAAIWGVLAMLVAFVSVHFSMRLASGRG
jgi:hypothetical protein